MTTATNIDTLTKRIKSLATAITKHARRLTEDRLLCGKLLIELRSQFSVQNKYGGYTGSHKGQFTAHLEANGINVGSAYNWIALAEGRTAKHRLVRDVMSKYVSRLNKATTQAEKRDVIREIVAYLRKRYKVS